MDKGPFLGVVAKAKIPVVLAGNQTPVIQFIANHFSD
jgi:hypothetical protein